MLHPSDRRGIAVPSLRVLRSGPVGEIAIGEIDQTLFDCPNCRRPLALGTRRCPGCRTRLVRGVVARKAVGFVAAGLALGVLVGFLGGAALGGAAAAPTPSRPPAASVPTTGSSAVPGPSTSNPTVAPTVAPTASLPPVGGGIPSVARSAMAQVLATNARLGAAEAELRRALGASSFDASAVAQTLRNVSAQAVFGDQLATGVATWSAGGELAGRLTTFYGTIHDVTSDALVNTVRNPAAYRAAAIEMADLLSTRAAIDDAVRSLAAGAGVSLPEPSTAP